MKAALSPHVQDVPIDPGSADVNSPVIGIDKMVSASGRARSAGLPGPVRGQAQPPLPGVVGYPRRHPDELGTDRGGPGSSVAGRGDHPRSTGVAN